MVSTDLGACEWFVWDLRRSNLKVVRGAGDERLLPALGDAATDAAHSRRNRATARPTCRRMTDVAGALR